MNSFCDQSNMLCTLNFQFKQTNFMFIQKSSFCYDAPYVKLLKSCDTHFTVGIEVKNITLPALNLSSPQAIQGEFL